MALYFVAVGVLLPTAEYPRALGGGTAVFATVLVIARLAGRGAVHGLSVLAVTFGSAAVLLVPSFPAMGGTRPITVPVGFLGMQAAALLWAARRWVPRPRASLRTPLARLWRAGAFAALLTSAIATIPIVLALADEGRAASPVLMAYPAYLAGALGAATVFWLLQPVAHLAAGRYLIGAVGGFCVYGAFMPLVMIADPGGLDLSMGAVMAAVCGGLVGPAVALGLSD
ncbi:MAG: hypothetical protein ICV87_15100 [Gemmatimonadetes bacterium]|nr:hypothetical protein [Gemmatimonadota bacterium]